jgi:hypothetical protein
MRARALQETTATKKVGIWDLGAWVGGLPHIIEALNGSQQVAQFFEIQAAIPAGLQSSAKKLTDFAETRLRRPLTREETQGARDAVLDVDFFPRGEAVRRDLTLDYLVGISPDSLAGIVMPPGARRRTIYFDFFSSSDDDNPNTSIVSVNGLRSIAAAANRPYEMVVGYLSVRAALVVLNGDRLAFHEDTGCLFDFTDDRNSIVRGLRTPHIEESCLNKIRKKYRAAALAMVRALDMYRDPREKHASAKRRRVHTRHSRLPTHTRR